MRVAAAISGVLAVAAVLIGADAAHIYLSEGVVPYAHLFHP